jgi:two-component system response regulator YesN
MSYNRFQSTFFNGRVVEEMLYKLVIVDDEPSVLNGLQTYFNWGAYGIELVGVADDGNVGLALINELKPDIVLTDVMMPTMDGIQMSMEIYEKLPDTKIVFISGHDNTAYLKSALKVHAVDYIFKPIVRKELGTVMERVVAALGAEAETRQLTNKMQVKLSQSMPLLREKFLMSVIRDSIKLEAAKEKIEFLELPLHLDGAYIILVIMVDDAIQVMGALSERDKQLTSYAILNIIQELMNETLQGVAFENESGQFVGILRLDDLSNQDDVSTDDVDSPETPEQQLLILAEKVRDNLSKWMKLSVTIGVGERVESLMELPQSYMRAKDAAAQKWYLGKNKILTIDSLESDKSGRYRFEIESAERVLSAMRAGDHARLKDELELIYNQLATKRKGGFRYARNVSLQFLLLSSRVLLELNALTEEWELREVDSCERVLQQETMQDMHNLVYVYLHEVCACVNNKRNSRAGGVIDRIQQLIEERYPENLTVADIAEGVFLSATYVSLLFKQETGETLFEYLTKVRIEKAKELLKDPRYKFYEVCEAVGYLDPSHFSKVFKKMTGFTPSAYREQH